MTIRQKGFTLVELLIVITILVILGIFVILLINPAEILAKSRDSQRISDLATMKGAMQLFLTDTTTDLTTFMTDNCAATIPIPDTNLPGRNKIFASLKKQPNSAAAAANKYSGKFGDTGDAARKLNNGTGWMPVEFTTVGSGAPLDSLPTDPSADLSADADTSWTDLLIARYYRFGCYSNGGKLEYEFDAGLESGTWGPAATGLGNKGANDGGNANSGGTTAQNVRYEAGNNLTILPATASIEPSLATP